MNLVNSLWSLSVAQWLLAALHWHLGGGVLIPLETAIFSLSHSPDMVNIFHNVAIMLHRDAVCVWLGL